MSFQEIQTSVIWDRPSSALAVASLRLRWPLSWVHAYARRVVRQHTLLRSVLRGFWRGFWGRVLRRVLKRVFKRGRVMGFAVKEGSERGFAEGAWNATSESTTP